MNSSCLLSTSTPIILYWWTLPAYYLRSRPNLSIHPRLRPSPHISSLSQLWNILLLYIATAHLSPVIPSPAATPMSLPTPAPTCTPMVSHITSIRFIKYLVSCTDHLAQSLLGTNLRPGHNFSPRPHISFDFTLVAPPQLPPRIRLRPRQYLRPHIRPYSHPSLPFIIIIYDMLFCTEDLSPTFSMPPPILTRMHTPTSTPRPAPIHPFHS